MKKGKLVAIVGPMFSGKTTYLISVYGDGKDTVVFKPNLDQRYTKRPVVVSHDRAEIPSVLVNNDRPQEMLELVGDSKRVFIDEANFFTGDLLKIVETLRNSGKDVYVAGLTQYADGDVWEPVHTIAELATERHDLTARCDGDNGTCKEPATRSYRKIPNVEKVSVAGADEYGAACEKHYPILHHKPKK